MVSIRVEYWIAMAKQNETGPNIWLGMCVITFYLSVEFSVQNTVLRCFSGDY